MLYATSLSQEKCSPKLLVCSKKKCTSLHYSPLSSAFLFFLGFCFSTECDLLFTDETADSVLTYFPQRDFHQKAINVPVNQTCSFYYGDKLYAQYLGCDGAWNEIPTQSVIDGIYVTGGWSSSRLQMRVSTPL